MFARRARSYKSTEEGTSKRRREGRGLGPFTGGQLTIVIVTFAVLLLFPIGAWAASSGVFITDSTGARKADVTAAGSLKVDTGLALPPFGVVPTVGRGGTVNAHVVYPTADIIHTDDGFADFVQPNNCSTGTCQTLLKPPAGKAAVVTSIHIDTYKATASGVGEAVQFFRSSDGTCSSSSVDRVVDVFSPSGIGETQLQYDLPGGLSVPAGKALCAQNSDPTSLSFEVSARGYAVASDVVPAS